MVEAIEKEEYRGHTISIVYDDMAENPREAFGNACFMWCEHGRYTLGDEGGRDRLEEEIRKSARYDPDWEEQEVWDETAEDYVENESYMDFDDDSDLLKALNRCEDIPWQPLYLYDHSGITISTSPFSCPWDSGMVGVIFVTKDVFKNEFSNDREAVAKCMNDEVELYDAYITGAVFGYVVEGPDCEDSCFGFYGWDRHEYMLQQAKDEIDYEVNARIMRQQAEEAENLDRHFEKLKQQIKHHVPLEKRHVYERLY